MSVSIEAPIANEGEFSQRPEQTFDEVDSVLFDVWTRQRDAQAERDNRLRRLHVVRHKVVEATVDRPAGVTPMSFDVLPSFVSPRQDVYRHVSFTEGSSPLLAGEAWRIHAEGYKSSGFVNQDAIDPTTGYLKPDIDKSRGPHIEYHVAVHPDKPDDRATLRIDGLAPGGTYKDHPAYQLCKDSLSQKGYELLESITDQDRRVKEIAAMAKTDKGHPMGIHEIIRKVIQEAQGRDEVWMFSIVSSTYDSLAKSFGAKNFEIIGENVPIPDNRVNPNIRLTPTVLYPDKFIDTILASYELSEDPRDKVRLLRSLLFLTEGLLPEQMSDAVRTMRQSVLEKAHHKSN